MNQPLSLIAAALALLVMVALGRGLERLVLHPPRAPMVATSLCAGLGLWTLAWLAFVPLGGGHTVLLAPLAALAALALAGNHLRRWARDRGAEEHYWSLPVLHVLLLAPWLPLLWAAGPTTLADFQSLQALTALAREGGWPAGGGQPFGHGAPGWHIAHLLPATATAVAGQDVIPATVALSFFALLAAASLVPAFTGTVVRWSNLPLVAAPGLLGALAFAPIALPIPAATPGLLLAPLALAVGALPLLRPGPVPTGWAALPHALALAWLATLHPLGLPAAVAVAVAWTALAFRAHGPTAGLVLAATLLVALPLLATLLLAQALWPWQGLNLSTPRAALASLAAMAPWPFEGPLWLQALHLSAFALAAVPVRLAARAYDGSSLARAAYGHPWLYALPLVALAVSVALALRPYAVAPPDAVTAHAHTIAADLRAKGLLAPHQPVAVVGMPPLAAGALQYHLPANPVRLVSDAAPLVPFHRQLREGGHGMAWLGPDSAQALFGLPDTPAASLFAEVTESGLVIRAIYPVPQAR